MLKTKRFAVLVVAGLMLFAGGCGSSNQGSQQSQPAKEVKGLSAAKPLAVNKEEGIVQVYTEVNGKYFATPTRHGVVFKDGKNGDKSIFVAYANQNDFHAALEELGAVPGDNLTLETEDTVEGSELEISVFWEGADKEYSVNEIIVDSTGKTFAPKFGGNKVRAAEIKTGCIFCLDSCPVGISSNSAHQQKSFDGGHVEFKGNQEVLPADGTPVVVTFKLVK